MSIIKSLKEKFEHVRIDEPKIPLPNNVTIDEKTIYRNRYNFGVNLGSFLVLESWIYGDLFDDVGGADTEFEAVSKCIQKFGVQDTISRLKKHYEEYITKIDWNFLTEKANITALRVPIGYWHVNNGSFLNGLPFEALQEIYQGAKPWDYLKDLIATAKQNNIGILIDMHGLPGGANGDAHSGVRNNPPVFFKTKKYLNKIYEILPFIVADVCATNKNIIGLQVVNEAIFDNSASDIKSFYSQAINSIRQVDNSLPIVISDGWWPEQWSNWISENDLGYNVIIDSHVYRCFSDEDKRKQAGQIIEELPKTVTFEKEKADFLVGEFSCVLDEETWKRTQGIRDEHIKHYGIAQTTLFSQVASFGWFFWTLQFKWGEGGEWGLIPMINKGNLVTRSKIKVNIDQNKVQNIINDHINYWNGKGDQFEHWRFEDGIRKAVSDLSIFNSFNNSRLGRWHSWTKQRRFQYVKEKGDSKFMWEWDQGYQRGLDEFNR